MMNLFENIILNEKFDKNNNLEKFYNSLVETISNKSSLEEKEKNKVLEELKNFYDKNQEKDFIEYVNKNIKKFGLDETIIKTVIEQLKKLTPEQPQLEELKLSALINSCTMNYKNNMSIANMFNDAYYNFICTSNYVDLDNSKYLCFYSIDLKTHNIIGGLMDINHFNSIKKNPVSKQNIKLKEIQNLIEYFKEDVNNNLDNKFAKSIMTCRKLFEMNIDQLKEQNFSYKGTTPKTDFDNICKQFQSKTINVFNINSQDLTKLINNINSNIQKMYAKHPYANAVVEEMKKNMTGDKYIKIGNPAYHEAVEFLKMRAKNVAFEKLNEDTNDVKDISSSMMKSGVNLVEAIYGTPKNLEWESKDFLKCVAAAKKGDQSAIGYLMYKHAPLIVNSYWKNFLGPNPKMRKIRIERDGGLKSSLLAWIGIALKALVEGGVDVAKKNGGERHRYSTLEGFRPRSVKGKPENAFSSHFRMDLITNAIAINNREDADGITNADASEITTTNLEFDNGRERDEGEDDAFVRDSLEDEIIKKIEDDDFMQNWLNYCQDEELLDGKKCTPSKALWKILTNPAATNMKEIAEECGVSRGTFESLAKKAIDILPKYEIDYRSLMDACDRYGNKKIASYLSHR